MADELYFRDLLTMALLWFIKILSIYWNNAFAVKLLAKHTFSILHHTNLLINCKIIDTTHNFGKEVLISFHGRPNMIETRLPLIAL